MLGGLSRGTVIRIRRTNVLLDGIKAFRNLAMMKGPGSLRDRIVVMLKGMKRWGSISGVYSKISWLIWLQECFNLVMASLVWPARGICIPTRMHRRQWELGAVYICWTSVGQGNLWRHYNPASIRAFLLGQHAGSLQFLACHRRSGHIRHRIAQKP